MGGARKGRDMYKMCSGSCGEAYSIGELDEWDGGFWCKRGDCEQGKAPTDEEMNVEQLRRNWGI